MRRMIGLVAALVMVLGPAQASYGPGELWFTFADFNIRESSGVASASYSDEIIFTHNDSGDTPRFFAVRASDGVTAHTFGLGAVVRQAVDWEDMARGPGRDGKPALFFGDIGDNQASETQGVRPFVLVHEIPEPVVDASQTGAFGAAPPTATMVLVYEDGPHNAETLLVDPATGQLGIVTKVTSGASSLYLAEPIGAAVQTLRRVATIDFPSYGATSAATTGGDITPDRSRVVVRTYNEAFEWTIDPGESLPLAMAGSPSLIDLPPTIQGEAIGYASPGDDLITTTEGGAAPVHRLARA